MVVKVDEIERGLEKRIKIEETAKSFEPKIDTFLKENYMPDNSNFFEIEWLGEDTIKVLEKIAETYEKKGGWKVNVYLPEQSTKGFGLYFHIPTAKGYRNPEEERKIKEACERILGDTTECLSIPRNYEDY